MKYYLAPMEGITGYITRNAFHHFFDSIDRYFTPFLPAGKKLGKRMVRDILPENNEGITVIPQLMSNYAPDVIDCTRTLRRYGYDTVNINLGCPSGTVANKGRGSGFLAHPDDLDRFFEEIFENTDFKISVKTRIGVHSADDWERILSIYARYPFEEVIIHPRLQKDFYKGSPRMEAFDTAIEFFAEHAPATPLCYNGDLVSVAGIESFMGKYPQVDRIMIGRGLLAKPGLVCATAGTVYSDEEYRRRLRGWHDEILENYRQIFSGDRDTMFHMKEVWIYLAQSFADSDRYLKQIKKSQSMQEYRILVQQIFENCPLVPLTGSTASTDVS